MHQTGGRVGGAVSTVASVQSLSRILREYREIQKDPSPYWCAFPINIDEPFEWHFTIRGPSGTEFEGGMYHGRIILPHSYPFSPPSLMMLTGNGRFEVGKKVCLSASNYHPELWQPAWGIRTMLDALHAFFPTPGEGAVHSLDWSAETRKKLAKDSINWYCHSCKQTNSESLARFCRNTEDENSKTRIQNENPLIQHLNKYINESKRNINEKEQDEIVELKEDTINETKIRNNSTAYMYMSNSCDDTLLNTDINNTKINGIPHNRLPPKICQQSIAWNLLLMKKPANFLEGIASLIDFFIGVLLITIILLFLKLLFSFILN